MGKRLSKIYTRTGDSGETGLGDGSRVGKDDARVCAYGTVDELNSSIGLLRCEAGPDVCTRALAEIQHHLFDLGSELCVPGYSVLTKAHVTWLETVLDHLNESIPALDEFILPGGSRSAAICHVARTQCRRAEREVVALGRGAELPAFAGRYMNRLSDLLFVMARHYTRHDGADDVLWQRGRGLPTIEEML